MTRARTAALAAFPNIVADPMPSGAVYFHNAGLIDIAAVTTMGVSVKDGDTPIGFFGTGLKFAIATILRNGGTVTVWRGLEPFVFSKMQTEIRGQSFDLVAMNGASLGFTTQLGRTWEPWMAYRELASNCRDEGGATSIEPVSPADGCTTIIVTGLIDVWHERQTILLDSTPIAVTDYAEIRPGPSNYVYYRGVRIFQPTKPTALLYNVTSPLELTEDRTAKNWYQVELAIERTLGALDDRSLIRAAMTCGDAYREHSMDVAKYGNPGPVFRDVVGQLAMGAENCTTINPAALQTARALALTDAKPSQHAQLERHQAAMLAKATAMLKSANYHVDEFDVVVMDTLGPNICGMAHEGKIFLSLLPFRKGTREVAATLLEEYAHLKSGAADCTREFQNWLFDQMLVQSERAAGEPF